MATKTLHLVRGRITLAAAVLLVVTSGAAAATAPRPTATSTRPTTVGSMPATHSACSSECVSGSSQGRHGALRFPARLPRRTIVVPILMYHRVNVVRNSASAMTRHLTVDPVDFERQMRWLKRHGYRTVTQHELFDALFNAKPLGRRPIMITFDDGYRDVFFKASPVLRRLGMRATAYVVSGRISGGDPSFLTWPLLHALECRGVEVGSHTVSHSDLTRLPDRAALAELVRSRRTLERELRHPVPWLAYPYGAYSPRIESLARRAGYVLAVTTRPGARQSARAPFALQRLRILDSTGVGGLSAMLESARRLAA